METRQQECRHGGVLIVRGHAINQDDHWYGGFPGEEQFYEQQVRDAVLFASAERRYGAVIASVGRVRPELPEVKSGVVSHSKGEGMRYFASDEGFLDKDCHFLSEIFARDNFQNVFLALL